MSAAQLATPPSSPTFARARCKPDGCFDAAALTSLLDEARDALQIPGLAATVTVGDAVVLHHAAGSLATSDPTPVDATTLFRVGTLAKTVTAAAVATLVLVGKLAWHRPVAMVVPEVSSVPNIQRVSVEDLVMHRAGIARHVDGLVLAEHEYASAAHRLFDSDKLHLLRFEIAEDLGSDVIDTDATYAFLTLLVDRVLAARPAGLDDTPRNFPAFVAKHVLGPLGLHEEDGDFAWYPSSSPSSCVARGHTLAWTPAEFSERFAGATSAAVDASAAAVLTGRSQDPAVLASIERMAGGNWPVVPRPAELEAPHRHYLGVDGLWMTSRAAAHWAAGVESLPAMAPLFAQARGNPCVIGGWHMRGDGSRCHAGGSAGSSVYTAVSGTGPSQVAVCVAENQDHAFFGPLVAAHVLRAAARETAGYTLAALRGVIPHAKVFRAVQQVETVRGAAASVAGETTKDAVAGVYVHQAWGSVSVVRGMDGGMRLVRAPDMCVPLVPAGDLVGGEASKVYVACSVANPLTVTFQLPRSSSTVAVRSVSPMREGEMPWMAARRVQRRIELVVHGGEGNEVARFERIE
ncbi:hypothetical protein H9P43_003737 [Blastocladiella emersonii ATCC 22665]|nr:hypothetical protein H9P43_003737 [Blastocladiella emersonii ATCC 22665]